MDVIELVYRSYMNWFHNIWVSIRCILTCLKRKQWKLAFKWFVYFELMTAPVVVIVVYFLDYFYG